MKRFFAKKYFSATSAALLFFFGLTQFANAQLTASNWVASGVASAFDNIGYYVIGKIAFGISYIIAWVAGVLITIEAWLVGAMLGINQGVFQAQIVQKGFGVTLSIANLGFVLGIIIIAIATILRRDESYGYKKTLWKLVAAAILVNFSLVIAAPIFSLGNSFTQYFLNCIDPAGGGCSGQGQGVGITSSNSMNDFASNLAGAFNPQVGLLSIASSSVNGSGSNSVAIGQSLGQMLVPILSILFVAAELVAIVIVLGSLVALLLIRYIWIAILAILMPFAWLGWVFPATKGWWSRWWSNFIRWTFFAPIVVFFLWLGMITAQSMSNGTAIANQQFGQYMSSSNAFWASISNLFTNIFTPIIAQVLNTLLLVGLSVGGIIVADRMSLTGAESVIKTAKAAGKGVQGFASKQAKKATRAVYDRGLKVGNRQIIPGGQKITTNLQEGKIGILKYVPGAQRAASLAGRGISEIQTNKDLVEEAKKKVPESPEEIRKNLRGSMNKQDQFAHLSKLIEKGELNPDDVVGDQKASEFLDQNEILVARYGQGKAANDANKVLGSDKDMRAAAGNVENLKATGASTSKLTAAVRQLDDATEKFVGKMEKGDISKININEVLGKNTEISRALVKRFALSAPQLVAGALPKMKSKNLKDFDMMYKTVIAKEVTAARMRGDAKLADYLAGTKTITDKSGKTKVVLSEDSVLGRYNKTFASNATGFAGTSPAGGGSGGGSGGGGAHP